MAVTNSELLEAQVLAQRGVLSAPNGFKLASLQELREKCNSCGSKDSWFRPPSTIYGTNILPACEIHDYRYTDGTTNEDKEEADREFKHNMFRLIERDSGKWYKPTKLQYIRALLYYKAVVNFGGMAFWSGKN